MKQNMPVAGLGGFQFEAVFCARCGDRAETILQAECEMKEPR